MVIDSMKWFIMVVTFQHHSHTLLTYTHAAFLKFEDEGCMVIIHVGSINTYINIAISMNKMLKGKRKKYRSEFCCTRNKMIFVLHEILLNVFILFLFSLTILITGGVIFQLKLGPN